MTVLQLTVRTRVLSTAGQVARGELTVCRLQPRRRSEPLGPPPEFLLVVANHCSSRAPETHTDGRTRAAAAAAIPPLQLTERGRGRTAIPDRTLSRGEKTGQAKPGQTRDTIR